MQQYLTDVKACLIYSIFVANVQSYTLINPYSSFFSRTSGP